MMRIISLDIATRTGWAFWDTSKHHSTIRCGMFQLGSDAKEAWQRRAYARDRIEAKVLDMRAKFQPQIVCIEQPLSFIKPNVGFRKGKVPLLGDAVPPPEKVQGGPNAEVVLFLNQVFASAWTMCRGLIRIEVAPQTWQTIAKKMRGETTKDRSIEFCRVMKIEIPEQLTAKPERGDAADAACIAYWCAMHAQEAKLRQREDVVEHVQKGGFL